MNIIILPGHAQQRSHTLLDLLFAVQEIASYTRVERGAGNLEQPFGTLN